MSKILVNAVGDACPIPVTKTIHALSGMTEAGTVEVHVDNETAVQNLNRLATGKGLKFSAEKREEKLFVVTLTVDDPAAVSGSAPEEAACTPDNRDNTVVVIGTSCLGSGDDTLGATLMKGFLYALSQQERLPRTILFYNGGAKITTEGSVSIEDLKNMEAQGVEIRTCGTCLNYYGLTDKLAVGSVTNMYDIVETMTSAGKVIRP
jgi:selenium metabolism protein YedF